MPLVKVKALQELPPGDVVEVQNGEATYVVCNVQGSLRCLEGICPHAGGPLGQGNLSGNQIVCPWHEWAFDTATGVNDYDEDLTLKTYPVVVQDGTVLIDVP
ncbi:MAG: Rieske (2Fe-2S) protein [Bryobacteraceae bacterium]